MHALLRMLILACFAGILSTANAQDVTRLIQQYLVKEKSSLELTDNDLDNWRISAQHTSAQTGLTHVYLIQTYNGIEVTEGVATFVINDQSVCLTGNRLLKNIALRIKTLEPVLSEVDAINSSASALSLLAPNDLKEIERLDQNTLVFSAPSLSVEDIPVELVYGLMDNGELRLAWELNIYEKSLNHWWNVKIDAITGELISQIDWVVSCSFGEHDHTSSEVCPVTSTEQAILLPAPPPGTDQYNVYAMPIESPNHGSRTLVVGPYDPIASPFGWHDDDGIAGAEYTITRGNNVRATEDINDNNGSGYFPDGGASLNFDFPLDLNQDPSGYLDPAITNLFYWNNIMHDVWYQYGFDEASGNFQQNNYGGGGLGSDYVRAEAQDGGGMNNANFATPDDGSNPRMQMYLWSPPNGPIDVLIVNSPVALAGTYSGAASDFGPPIPATPLTGDLVLYEDNIGNTYDACEDPTLPATLVGKIVYIQRGSCNYVDQVQRAQDAGAIAVIVANNSNGIPFSMTGLTSTITIPSVMISQADGDLFRLAVLAGDTINLSLSGSGPFEIDGDFDNGIIAHEYGHGISNRLTGGPNNSGCLSNEDQMGEGWSDWFGLMLTIKPGDLSTDVRGIGTYATGQPTTAQGIRPGPYSTDPAENSYTYGHTNSPGISQPHGIGFVWCTMIWDLNWALIDEYGYDNDVYFGTGGNNIAMNLVMNGIKLQPCSPGFVDGRDAILQADQLLYNGVHECLIWTVFANRGLGYSADQGSTDDRFDQVQAFDMPPPISPLTTVSVCGDYIWAVNGLTYSTPGIYMAPLGGLGCSDSATLDLTIISGLGVNIIQNGTILTSSQGGLGYQWVDCDNNFAPVAGATTQSFNPTVSGNYAVIVSGSQCVDTTICTVVLVTTGILVNDFGNALQLYPNPTDGDVTIKLGSQEKAVNVIVYDISGREISRNSFIEVDSFELSISGEVGTYLVEITTDSGKRAQVKVQKTK